MIAEGVDPRDVSWEDDAPAYRVCFWEAGGVDASGEPRAPMSDEWRLRGAADVEEVLAWAGAHAAGRRIVVHAETRGSDGALGLLRLLGTDPSIDPGAG